MDKDQLDQLMSALDEMAGMISKIRESIPGDSAEEQASELEDGTAEAESQETSPDEESPAEDAGEMDPGSQDPAAAKLLKKNAAVAMLRKSL